MKRITILLFLIVLVGFVFIECLTNYVSKESLIGSYINNNTEYILEGPKPISYGIDTLKLNYDNTFESQTWGEGTYLVKSSILGSTIRLTYEYERGKGYMLMPVVYSLKYREKIYLDYDMNFYFEKIK